MIQIRRRRRRSKKQKGQSDFYFNADTQAAIVEHQTEIDPTIRAKIYVSRIHPAFDKLVENLINIHKFSGLYDSHSDLKSDCITFLYESLHKFDPNRGTAAFSYYNIVAKHWLIIRSKQKASKLRKNVSMDDALALTTDDAHVIEQHGVIPSQDEIIEKREFSNEIVAILDEIRSSMKTPNEIACIDSIITLFGGAYDLDLLNKSAILLYIREMSGLTPKQLTMTMFVIKKKYRELKGADIPLP